MRVLRVGLVIAVLLPGAYAARSAPAAKRPLSHRDYDSWREVAGPVVSRDGRLLAYSYMPQDGDGDLVIRSLKTGQERRIGVGDLPAQGPDNPDEPGSEDAPPNRRIRIAITSDGAYVIANTYPTKAEVERARKDKKLDDLPKAGLVIVDTRSGATTRIAGVKSLQVPAKGGAWLAYLRESKAADKDKDKDKDEGGNASKETAGAARGAQPGAKAEGKPVSAEKPSPGPGEEKGTAAPGEKPGAAPTASKSEPKAGAREEKGGGGQGRGRGGRGGKTYGTELVIRDLARGREQTLAHVLDYSFARDGKNLVYTVSSPREQENGLYAVAPGSGQPPRTLLAGKGKYSRLTWDRAQSELAFVSDRDDAQSKTPRLKAYLWPRGAAAAVEAVTQQTPGFPASLAISDKAGLSFSRDGKHLFVAAGPPPKPGKDPDKEKEKEGDKDKDKDAADDNTAAAADKVRADLWHWKDDVVQPMQRVRANQDRNRTFRGVYHLAEKKYVQLADDQMRTAISTDDARRAIGLDDHAYRRLVDYDGNYSDVYLLDGLSGARKLAIKQLRGAGLSWSPDGKHAFYYTNRHWFVLDADGAAPAVRILTDKIPVAFSNERHDTPGPPASYGSAGWIKDSRSFLVYDRYDIWQLFVDGRAARNVTEGQGRKQQIELRVERIEPREEDDEERGIDPDQPLTLRAVHESTRASGFYRDSLAGSAPPQRLLWGDHRYTYVGRALDADVLLVSASRFDEYPDLYTTDSSFRHLTKVTNGGAQLAAFRWGSAELIHYKSADGVPLQGALFKPDGFDPHKKYPLLLNIYERLSQNVHGFRSPGPGTSINISYYVSNGYLVLTPDIVYAVGHPGPSALKCVLPAIQAVVDRGFVDEKAIGIQGHSWGGYQIAYMVTQTNRFRAAAAGAPVGNMTSAYSGIRWGTGQPRQWQYEQAQSRLGRLLYEAPLEYLENSPVFHVQNVQTPLLILHNDGDTAVPWYQGIELYLGLRRVGKEVYLWNYNGEPHGLRRRANQKDYTVRMQQFFDHLLKGAPRPAWMEKGIPFIERDEEKERANQVEGTSS